MYMFMHEKGQVNKIFTAPWSHLYIILHPITSQNLIHCGALVAWSQGGDHEPQHPQLHATPIISLAFLVV